MRRLVWEGVRERNLSMLERRKEDKGGMEVSTAAQTQVYKPEDKRMTIDEDKV